MLWEDLQKWGNILKGAKAWGTLLLQKSHNFASIHNTNTLDVREHSIGVKIKEKEWALNPEELTGLLLEYFLQTKEGNLESNRVGGREYW